MKTKISDIDKVRIIGIFLAKYEQNLEFILKFQNDKEKKVISKDGIESFYKFLIEFNVIRNIEKGTSSDLYKDVLENEFKDVDELADFISKQPYSNNHRLISLASKVLFLNNPWDIIPLDRNNKNALGIKTDSYKEFKSALDEFKNDNEKEIDDLIDKTKDVVKPITEKYSKQIRDLDKIYENRIIDKMLWVLGE